MTPMQRAQSAYDSMEPPEYWADTDTPLCEECLGYGCKTCNETGLETTE